MITPTTIASQPQPQPDCDDARFDGHVVLLLDAALLPDDAPAASYDLPGSRLLDLVAVMDRLRAECPWDREQTHRSLATYLLEETYETLEAIESGDTDHLREELGDLLLQVVFHARVAAEQGSEAAFRNGAAVLDFGWQAPLAREQLSTATVGQSLERLRHLSPFAKPAILKACVETAAADGSFRLAEAELVRMVAATLDCPVPPVLAAA